MCSYGDMPRVTTHLFGTWWCPLLMALEWQVWTEVNTVTLQWNGKVHRGVTGAAIRLRKMLCRSCPCLFLACRSWSWGVLYTSGIHSFLELLHWLTIPLWTPVNFSNLGLFLSIILCHRRKVNTLKISDCSFPAFSCCPVSSKSASYICNRTPRWRMLHK
jgi:hypothetical protein